MAAADSMTVAINGAFQDRVRYFLVKAAVAVMAEAGNTAGHALRVTYANAVLAGSAPITPVSVAVTTNATVAAAGFAATDGDLEFVVNSLFSALSGVAN